MTQNRWNIWWNIFTCPVTPLIGTRQCNSLRIFSASSFPVFLWHFSCWAGSYSDFTESLLIPGRSQYGIIWKEMNSKFVLTRAILSWWSHNFHISRSGRTKHNIKLWTLISFIKNLARSMFYSLFCQVLHICTLSCKNYQKNSLGKVLQENIWSISVIFNEI